jgi:hypothetical protein
VSRIDTSIVIALSSLRSAVLAAGADLSQNGEVRPNVWRLIANESRRLADAIDQAVPSPDAPQSDTQTEIEAEEA